jgi:methionyl-tRNA formyltransferase
MTDKKPRIVFMGTPPFAVASLQALLENGSNIVAVVTAPDKPAGRGQQIKLSAVKEYALESKLPILQPERLRDHEFLASLRETNADIFVVVAFRMLPEEVWSIPRLGTFNLHASLLPLYRGAAPINHAIINGETKTGVTTFLIDHEIDTGKILLSREIEISVNDNAGSLHDRLMTAGAALVIETVRGLYDKSIQPVPQREYPGLTLPKAPKIFPADTVIDWREPAGVVHNKIRGLSPYPGAVTTIKSGNRAMRLKLIESSLSEGFSAKAGTIITSDKAKMIIACGTGAIEILSLQPEGRKKMDSSEFLRGYDMKKWIID